MVHRDESPLQLLVQRLGEHGPDVPARAHLDLGTDDIAVEVARVERLGASVLWHRPGFVALQDPEGMASCVTGNDPEA